MWKFGVYLLMPVLCERERPVQAERKRWGSADWSYFDSSVGRGRDLPWHEIQGTAKEWKAFGKDLQLERTWVRGYGPHVVMLTTYASLADGAPADRLLGPLERYVGRRSFDEEVKVIIDSYGDSKLCVPFRPRTPSDRQRPFVSLRRGQGWLHRLWVAFYFDDTDGRISDSGLAKSFDWLCGASPHLSCATRVETGFGGMRALIAAGHGDSAALVRFVGAKLQGQKGSEWYGLPGGLHENPVVIAAEFAQATFLEALHIASELGTGYEELAQQWLDLSSSKLQDAMQAIARQRGRIVEFRMRLRRGLVALSGADQQIWQAFASSWGLDRLVEDLDASQEELAASHEEVSAVVRERLEARLNRVVAVLTLISVIGVWDFVVGEGGDRVIRGILAGGSLLGGGLVMWLVMRRPLRR